MNRILVIDSQDYFDFLYAVLFRGSQELKLKGTASFKLQRSIKNKFDNISIFDEGNTKTGRTVKLGSHKITLSSDEYSMMERFLEVVEIPIDYDFAETGIKLFETALKGNVHDISEAGSEN